MLGSSLHVSRWATLEASTPRGLLQEIYEKEVVTRSGPHAHAKIRSFKEDRTLPLAEVHKRF